MTAHVRLASRIFAGDDGLAEWTVFAKNDPRSTLVIAGAGASENGVLMGDVLIAYDNPRIEIQHVDHPRVDQAENLTHILRQDSYSRIVAIGGGSVLDLAKAALYLESHGEFSTPKRISLSRRPGIQLVAVPTTLSGAEVNPGFGIVEANLFKKVLWDESLAPEVVILHPQALKGVPLRLIAASGVNALAHCIEGLYTLARDVWCDPLAFDSIERIVRWLPAVKQGPLSPQATGELQRASVQAGWVAFGSRPALHHAICHVLGSRLGVSHALLNAIMLPHVLDNVPQNAWRDSQDRVIAIFRKSFPGTPGGIADLTRSFIGHLLDSPVRLRDVWNGQVQISEVAETIASQVLVQNHPVRVTTKDVERLLGGAW